MGRILNTPPALGSIQVARLVSHFCGEFIARVSCLCVGFVARLWQSRSGLGFSLGLSHPHPWTLPLPWRLLLRLPLLRPTLLHSLPRVLRSGFLLLGPLSS